MTPDLEAVVAEQVFVALADPTRRAILAALATDGPATATDLAARLPITRQAITKHLALMADTGLVTPEPGERRRIRYRLRPAPVQLAQQFPRRHRQRLGRPARCPQTPPHGGMINHERPRAYV
ncbi:MAG: ArsR/SmtB family transcription factor, partial [Trebonia sp.]